MIRIEVDSSFLHKILGKISDTGNVCEFRNVIMCTLIEMISVAR